ncbi:MAG: aspartate/glutamate racemase family protein [Bacteroidetes bacterium]|nr:aspartate/glutamate racemase family protein [Bacteroidota bacterium]
MKTIGIVGGTSWISTQDYYKLFNQLVNERRGGDEAAKIVLYSVNFGEIKQFTLDGQWDEISKIICDAAKRVESAGADCILLGANTMHKIAGDVQQAVSIPLIHIADAVGRSIKQKKLKKVALLGTKYTMQLPFYKDRLASMGIDIIIPDPENIEMVNNAIYDELGKGIFLPGTKQKFLDLIRQLSFQGAEGIILGCTEIPMLIKPEDTSVALFDTTLIHATAAVDFVLA